MAVIDLREETREGVFMARAFFDKGYAARLPKRGHLKHTFTLCFSAFYLQNRNPEFNPLDNFTVDQIWDIAQNYNHMTKPIFDKCFLWLCQNSYFRFIEATNTFTLIEELRYRG